MIQINLFLSCKSNIELNDLILDIDLDYIEEVEEEDYPQTKMATPQQVYIYILWIVLKIMLFIGDG